jgi:hypothetical protein
MNSLMRFDPRVQWDESINLYVLKNDRGEEFYNGECYHCVVLFASCGINWWNR